MTKIPELQPSESRKGLFVVFGLAESFPTVPFPLLVIKQYDNIIGKLKDGEESFVISPAILYSFCVFIFLLSKCVLYRLSPNFFIVVKYT